jgi:hypothetical protein
VRAAEGRPAPCVDASQLPGFYTAHGLSSGEPVAALGGSDRVVLLRARAMLVERFGAAPIPSFGFGFRYHQPTRRYWESPVLDGARVAYSPEAGYRFLFALAAF